MRNQLRSDDLLADAFQSKSKFRLCIDGGLRQSGDAAAGFALLTQSSQSSTYEVLARKGCLLQSAVSAFAAEAIATELALEWLLERSRAEHALGI